MNDIEEIVSNLSTPGPSGKLDDRMDQFFKKLAPEDGIGCDSLTPLQTAFDARRRLMLRGLGFTGALAASGLLIFGLTSGLGGATPVYAQVVESVQGLSSVKYLQVGIGTRQQNRGDDVPSPAAVGKDAISKRMDTIRDLIATGSFEVSKKRELEAELRVLSDFIKEDSPPLVSLAWCQVNAPDQLRSEVVFPYHAVNIHNGNDTITLDAINRRAIRRTTTILDQHGDRVSVGRSDFIYVLQMPEMAVKELPARTIDGVSFVGFERKTNKKGSTQTWWVEEGSSLPTRVEIKNCFKKNVVSSEMVYREITYNVDIASEMFDTVPPDGYELSEESTTLMFDTESADQN